MNVVICIGVLVLISVVITCLCVVNNPCISCKELAVMCKSCKHYNPPLVASNYEPREDVKEVDFLAKRINALTDEEFLQLSKLVVIRGYDNGRD